jgi:hypothetical protein
MWEVNQENLNVFTYSQDLNSCLGRNSHIDDGGGGATFSAGRRGVSGCGKGDEAFFLL